MDSVVDMWVNFVIIICDSINLMKELIGDRCFDFDDLRIFNTYQIETNHEYVGEYT